MYQSAKRITSICSQGLGSGLCNCAKSYCSHVRSKLDYGCVVYGSGRQSVPESLDHVQNASLRLSHPLIAEILCHVHGILSGGISVGSMWIPSDSGVAVNSAADIAAKAALLLPVSNLTVPRLNYHSLIRTQALKQWQLRLNSKTQNKMHAIKTRVNVNNLLHLPSWDEIIIHKLRLWHTYLTKRHLLQGRLSLSAQLVMSSWQLSILYFIVFLLQMLVFKSRVTFNNWFHQRNRILS